MNCLLKCLDLRKNYKELQDTLSKGIQWFIVCNALLRGFYAFGTQAFWVGAPGIVNLPLAAVTLFYLYRADKVLRRVESKELVSNA